MANVTIRVFESHQFEEKAPFPYLEDFEVITFPLHMPKKEDSARFGIEGKFKHTKVQGQSQKKASRGILLPFKAKSCHVEIDEVICDIFQGLRIGMSSAFRTEFLEKTSVLRRLQISGLLTLTKWFLGHFLCTYAGLGSWESQFWSIITNHRLSLESIEFDGKSIFKLLKDNVHEKGEEWRERYRQALPKFATKHPSWFLHSHPDASWISGKNTLISLLENKVTDVRCFNADVEESDEECLSLSSELFAEQRMLHTLRVNITSLHQASGGCFLFLFVSHSFFRVVLYSSASFGKKYFDDWNNWHGFGFN